MKKWLFLFLLVFSLTGCGNNSGYTDEEDIKNENPSQDEYVLTEEIYDEEAGRWIPVDDVLYDDFGYIEEMEPEDCLAQEIYDEIEKVCYLECETSSECERLAKEVYGDTEDIINDYFGDQAYDYTPEFGSNHGDEDAVDQSIFIEYEIKDGSIQSPKVVNQSFEKEISNIKLHKKIWTTLQVVAPMDFFDEHISKLQLFSEKEGSTAAYVTLDENNFPKWMVGVNVDILNDEVSNNEEGLIGTLIHEFAHVLTLREGQVALNKELIGTHIHSHRNNGDNFASSCPTFHTGEGCSHKKSYIHAFHNSFWKKYGNEHNEIQEILDDEAFTEKMNEFFVKYQTDFVSEYAASNPGEDIAESYTAFILREKPIGNTLADRKIRFFYSYDELVSLRDYTRRKIQQIK